MATYTDNVMVYDGATKQVLTANSADTISLTALKVGGLSPTANGTIDIGTEDLRFSTYWGNINGALQIKTKNDSGGTIYKGQAVYHKGVSGTVPTVALARANSASTMPCIGIALHDANDSAELIVIGMGMTTGFNTGSLSNDANLYVSASNNGGLDIVPPTGENNIVQAIAQVIRSDSTDGVLLLLPGEPRSVPNLGQGKMFIGDSTGVAVKSKYESVTIVSSSGSLSATVSTELVATYVYIGSGNFQLVLPLLSSVPNGYKVYLSNRGDTLYTTAIYENGSDSGSIWDSYASQSEGQFTVYANNTSGVVKSGSKWYRI